MSILLSISKVAKCLQNYPQRDLLTGLSSRIYEKEAILTSYYLWVGLGLSFKILNFVKVPQISHTRASNVHLKTLYLTHTML